MMGKAKSWEVTDEFWKRVEPALQLIDLHGYIPHVKGRHQEQQDLKRVPGKKARRWIVEVAHSWFKVPHRGSVNPSPLGEGVKWLDERL